MRGWRICAGSGLWRQGVASIEWGTNRFFFNREAILRFKSCGRVPTSRERRELFHSDLLAKNEKVIVVDGYVSPVCFCHIHAGEQFFRNNRHYFYSVSRNIESSMDIARTICENIFYTDEDLFIHIMSVCLKKFGRSSIVELTKEEKMIMARDLHYNYNASNKQISRLLKIDLSDISVIFPEKT